MVDYKCKECGELYNTLDSLRRHRVQKHNVNSEQTYIDYVLNGVKPICKCGCGLSTNFLSIEKGFVEYIRGHSSKIKNNWGHNPEAIKKSHETQKKMYESGELTIWNKGLTIEDERVKKNVEQALANPNRGKNISLGLSGVAKSEAHKLKLSKTAKLRWSDPKEREEQSNRRMEYIVKNGFFVKSRLETHFKEILTNDLVLIENVDFHSQHYVRDIKALFDFKIKGKKILIEVDGDFWHCNPNTIFKEAVYDAQKSNVLQDKIKNDWCQENGFKLIRFWETDILTKREEVIKTLKEELRLL